MQNSNCRAHRCGDAPWSLGLGAWGGRAAREQWHDSLEPLTHLPLSSGLPQRSLALAEQKCEQWKSQYEALKEDWKTLGTQHRELESQLHVLQSKLQVPGPGGREQGREGRI